jgi:hypothetical protein
MRVPMINDIIHDILNESQYINEYREELVLKNIMNQHDAAAYMSGYKDGLVFSLKASQLFDDPEKDIDELIREYDVKRLEAKGSSRFNKGDILRHINLEGKTDNYSIVTDVYTTKNRNDLYLDHVSIIELYYALNPFLFAIRKNVIDDKLVYVKIDDSDPYAFDISTIKGFTIYQDDTSVEKVKTLSDDEFNQIIKKIEEYNKKMEEKYTIETTDTE